MKKTVSGVIFALALALSLSLAIAVPAGAVGMPSLIIQTQPGGTIPGQPIAGPPTVQAHDETGSPVPGVSVTVTEIGHSYTFDAGTLTRTTNGSGIATFDDLVINTPGTGYQLQFSAPVYGTVSSGLFSVLSPTEVWVAPPPTGDDANPGTEAEPFATIQRGIDRVASPGTVHVAAGTYNEHITLVDGVQVLGAGASVTTIDGTDSGTVVTAVGVGASTVLSGFTIQNGYATNGGGMYNENASPTVSNCTFYDNDATQYGGGMFNFTGSSPAVTDCIFTGNTAGYLGGGMHNQSSSSPVVTNCTFAGNQATNDAGGGMCNFISCSPILTNCTFYNNTGYYHGGGMYNNNSSPTLTNCIFWGDSPEEIFNGSSTPVVTYCDVQGGYGVPADNNINADPMFANAGAGDFHLLGSSPCIDAGSDAAVPVGITTDFEGDSRIIDGDGDTFATVDMGVDEYVPPPTEVWVDDDWTCQADVDLFDPTLIWQYDAFATIQEGIDAVVGSIVHVAAGTYYENINLVDGVQVLGAGAGVSYINGMGSGTVVTADGVGATTLLDGFSIYGGSSYNGGGMQNINGSQAVVSNCEFYSNEADGGGGGGMFNDSSSPTVSNCTFEDNQATQYGGGMYNYGGTPTVTSCTFYENTSDEWGGGMANLSSSPTVTNCVFSSNTALSDTLDTHGGGVYNHFGAPNFINCTIYGNTADYGGGMYNYYSNAVVTNCILWLDTPQEIYNDNSTPLVTYCDVYNADPGVVYPGTGNINANPSFVDTLAGDFHLLSNSPCIDFGNNAAPDLPATDFEWQPRIWDGNGDLVDTVDMGVDEVVPAPTVVWVDDDWVGTPPGAEVDTGKFFGYNAFATITEGIDAVTGSIVNVAAGYYTENITLEDGLQVVGAGAGSTTIDGGGNDTVVTAINVGNTTLLSGFTITNGLADYGGGMYNQNSLAIVTLCTFTGNTATSYGGGMYNCVSSSPTVTDCTFSGNTAEGGGGMFNNYYCSPQLTNCTFTGNDAGYAGGGMYNYHSSPTVTGCTFTSNTADNDGGGMGNSNDSSPILTDCTFTSNDAGYAGGGMSNWDNSSPILNGCTFTGNSADYGGGMYNIDHCTPQLTSCTFTSNTATDDGGGMYNLANCTPILDTCTFTTNTADYGGGMYNEDNSSPTLDTCTFIGNSAYYGGGMYNYNSSAILDTCTFTSNQATSGDGGGMYNYNSSAILDTCTFTSNQATSGDGGGMYNEYSDPAVTDCTFTGNIADDDGGGMYNYYSDSVVTNCTFYGNTTTLGEGSGMYNYNNSSPTVTNCIFWGDTPDEISNDGTSAPAVTYCDVQGGYAGTGNINADPLFFDAGTGDFHLQATSPCVDVGNNSAPSLPATDIDGEPRILNGVVDMGVDECLSQVWVNLLWAGTTPGDPVPVYGYIFGTEAFDNITDGIGAVFPGGTVNVYPGTYFENNFTIDKSLTVQSVSADWSDTIIILDGGYGFQFISYSGDATISGFTITDGSDGIYIEGTSAGSSITVSNCLICDNNGSGILGGDILSGAIFIDDCIIGENGVTTGIHLASIYGTVEITDSAIGTYYDGGTVCEGNAGNGIQIDNIYETGTVLIDNCRIAQNGGHGIADYVAPSGCQGQLTITNNIIGAYDCDLADPAAGEVGGNDGCGIYIDHVGTTGVVTIEGNRIAGNFYGISFGGSSTIDGEVIINNNYIGAWTQSDGSNYNQYPGNDEKGISVQNVSTSGTLIIINNIIAENSFEIPNMTGLYINTTSGDTIIAANIIGAWTQEVPGIGPITYEGNGGPGIRISEVAGGRLLIIGNTVAENTGILLTGMHIDSAVDTADVSVHLNNILDNDGEGIYYNDAGVGYLDEIDAENNWWGDDSGPATGEGGGTGDEVSAHVDYTPWLGVAVDNALAGAMANSTLNATAANNTEVIVTGSATVITSHYSGDPGTGGFSGGIGSYIDVYIDDPTGVTELEIRFYYTDAEIAGLDETSLSLYWWDGASWIVCSESGVETDDIPPYSGYIWALIRGDTEPTLAQLTGSVFGGGGMLIPPAVGAGDTTGPVISNVATNCYGGVTETTADICWTTDEPGTSQVEFEASPGMLSPIDTRLVTVHHVQLTGLTPGTTYHYRTMSRDGYFNLTISEWYTFTTLGGESPAAAFASSSLSISPAEVDVGEAVTIGVLVTNSGDLAGSYEVTLEINGVAEETIEVTLDAGASQSVSFTVSRDEAGSYSVLVDGLSGSFTVTVPDTSQPSAPAEEEDSPLNIWPIVGGVIGAVVVIGLVVFVVRRRAG